MSMNNDPSLRHLSAETIQAFLDDALSAREAAAAEEHASSCARCRSDLEAWRALFSELGRVVPVAPSPGFREQVLAKVRADVPFLERLKRWLADRRKAGSGVPGHVSPERLQDYVEGLLPAGPMARVKSHLQACESCRQQQEAWRAFVRGLEGLPALDPSPGFAARVMGGVRIPERVSAPAPRRRRTLAGLGGWLEALRPVAGGVVALARRLQPTTRRGWTVAGVVAAAPVALFAAAAWWVAVHPLLSAGSMLTFGWWKASETTGALMQTLADGFLNSPLATQGYALVEQVGGSPTVLAGAVASFCVLTVLSLYVLYRNVIASRPVEPRYVHFSF